MEHNNDVLIDTGASSFIPLQAYVLDHRQLEMLMNFGKEIWLHYVLLAGQAQMDCRESLGQGLSDFASAVHVVSWENEYFERLQFELNGEASRLRLQDTPLWKTLGDRLKKHVVLDRRGELFVHDVEQFLKSGLTFAEIESDSIWSLMSRHRLKITKQLIWDQLDRVFQVEVVSSADEAIDS